MEKFEIKNRYGLKIVGEISIPNNSVGLVFVLHGLGSNRNFTQIKKIVKTFLNKNYTVVSYDSTNSFGESGGRYEDATMQSYYDDLCDVVDWSKKQSWYTEPFIIAGTSLGSYSSIRFAEENNQIIKAVFSLAGVVSGKLSLERTLKYKPEKIKKWKESGWFEEESFSNPGLIKRLPWSHMEERLNHDLLPKISNIVMPILFVVGTEDISHIEDQKILMNSLSQDTKKELHLIEGGHHTLRDENHLNELENILNNWIDKLK